MILADKKRNRSGNVEGLIEDTKEKLESTFSLFIQIIGSDMVNKIMREWKRLPESKEYKAGTDVEPWYPNAYYELVKLILLKSTVDSKEQVYGMTNRKLSEFNLAEYKNKKINSDLKELESSFTDLEKLVDLYKYNPSGYNAEVRDLLSRLESKAKSLKEKLINEGDLTSAEISRINAKVDLLIDTQAQDIKKAVALQYQSSVSATDSEMQLRKDLNDKTSQISYGTMVTGGSGVMASQAVNDGRTDAMSDIEDQIESYTFIAVDDDATTEICSSLDGTTFAPDDPNLDKYRPPLHFNCRSYILPNLRSFKSNPEIDEKTQLSKTLEGQIQFSESCCTTHTKDEHLDLLFRRLRQRSKE